MLNPKKMLRLFKQGASDADRQRDRGLAGQADDGTEAGTPGRVISVRSAIDTIKEAEYRAWAAARQEIASRTPRAREGEFVGWRQWLLKTCDRIGHPHLHSFHGNMCWDSPVAHADQQPPADLPKPPDQAFSVFPAIGNGPGLYALKAPWSLRPLRQLKRHRDHDFRYCDGLFVLSLHAGVFGQVQLYGLVREHEHGYRAEHAIINSLALVLRCGLCGSRDSEVVAAEILTSVGFSNTHRTEVRTQPFLMRICPSCRKFQRFEVIRVLGTVAEVAMNVSQLYRCPVRVV